MCLAGLINALKISRKDIRDIKLVISGAGAAGVACMKLIQAYGARKENCFMCDTKGVIYPTRKEGMNEFKMTLANASVTKPTTLAQICDGADVLIGVSGPGVFTAECVNALAKDPVIFAMANPMPEIMPSEAKKLRPDCTIATGRSDFPNQINNVMCFPFLFRATLDCRARSINEDMKMAAALALADLATKPVPREVQDVYPDRDFTFGRDYVIPTPFDPRLISVLPVAVAKAAEKSGEAQRPIADYEAYASKLQSLL